MIINPCEEVLKKIHDMHLKEIIKDPFKVLRTGRHCSLPLIEEAIVHLNLKKYCYGDEFVWGDDEFRIYQFLNFILRKDFLTPLFLHKLSMKFFRSQDQIKIKSHKNYKPVASFLLDTIIATKEGEDYNKAL